MIRSYQGYQPQTASNAWIADSADVIGKVIIDDEASIWFQSVIRGDGGMIHIGKQSNIQDRCVLHCDPENELLIGEGVSVGHGAILHGCEIHDHCLIGMGALIMNGAVIESDTIIAAGAVVLEHTRIPSGSLVVGCPGKIIKTISEVQKEQIRQNALHYVVLKQEYSEEEANG